MTQTSINNMQLNSTMLVEQKFSGFSSINDVASTEVKVTLPALIDLYISLNKSTITYATLHKLSLMSRYLIDESVKLEDYPVYNVRYNTSYDFTLVPTINPLSQIRTGKILYQELTNDFIYRFVTHNIANSTTFDIYADSNFIVTDVPVTFTFGNLSFENWLSNNRFKDVKTLLETYFDTNFTIKNMMDYISLGRTPSNDVIKYLSSSLEFIESMQA